MEIACFRCGDIIDTPGLKAWREPDPTGAVDSEGKPKMIVIKGFNADYIMASDTVVDELRTVFIAKKETVETLKKKSEGKPVADDEYDEEEVETVKDAVDRIGKDLFMVEARQVMKPIQKTGIVHPRCYLPTDTVIWGAHKEPKDVQLIS